MTQVSDGWPELTYRYIEHYFWEAQVFPADLESRALWRRRAVS